VFILYGIVAGILIGYALGGRLERLGRVRLRWVPLAIAGLAVQVVLFTDAGWSLAGGLGPAIYVGSTGAVLVVVLANLRTPGLPLVALGAASNLAAIVANGGSMPADPEALASLGLTAGGATNSVVVADPALRPLTDVFAMPGWLPLANVFSLGDVLILVGVTVAIAASMRAPGGRSARLDPLGRGGPGTGAPEDPTGRPVAQPPSPVGHGEEGPASSATLPTMPDEPAAAESVVR
jgi:Family of unknown function (DUF5317)